MIDRGVAASLSDIAGAERAHRTVVDEHDRVESPAVDCRHSQAGESGHPSGREHVGVVAARRAAEAELPILIVAPREGRAVTTDREGMLPAGADHDDVLEARDWRRRRASFGIAQPELSRDVLTPGEDSTVRIERERRSAAGGNGGDALETADAKRSADLAALSTDSELPGAIGAPRHHRAVPAQRQAVGRADRNLSDVAQPQHQRWLRPRAVADFTVAKPAVDLIAPRVNDAAAGQQKRCPVACGNHRRDRTGTLCRRCLIGCCAWRLALSRRILIPTVAATTDDERDERRHCRASASDHLKSHAPHLHVFARFTLHCERRPAGWPAWGGDLAPPHRGT